MFGAVICSKKRRSGRGNFPRGQPTARMSGAEIVCSPGCMHHNSGPCSKHLSAAIQSDPTVQGGVIQQVLGSHLCLNTGTTSMSSIILTMAPFVASGPIPRGGSSERTTLTSCRCEMVPSVSLTWPHILSSSPICAGLNAHLSSLCTKQPLLPAVSF